MSSKALYQLQDVTKNFYLESGVIEVLCGLTLEIASGGSPGRPFRLRQDNAVAFARRS